MLQFVRYTQHIHTYDMRRNKHNIQTYYRTRLYWLKNDNDKENKQFVSTKHFVTVLLKKLKNKKPKKNKTQKTGKKDSQSGGLFTWYRMIDINVHTFNSFLLLTVFIKFRTVYIFGFLQSLVLD